jgi:hypothetical protein
MDWLIADNNEESDNEQRHDTSHLTSLLFYASEPSHEGQYRGPFAGIWSFCVQMVGEVLISVLVKAKIPLGGKFANEA